MAIAAGIDGCRGGWLCVTRQAGTGVIGAEVYGDAGALFRLRPEPAVIAIDIPIGLTEAGPRVCDVQARRLLGRRRSSVFPAPIRAVLNATTRQEADSIGRRTDGRGVPAQAFGIYGKIRDVDKILAAEPQLRERVREVHPEVCFWAWNGKEAMLHAKRTKEGKAERRALVEEVFGARIADEVRAKFPRAIVATDDIHDAFAALWTAERILEGKAGVIPNRSPRDRMKLDMKMWY